MNQVLLVVKYFEFGFCEISKIGILILLGTIGQKGDYIENNTWMCGNMKFISSLDQDISRVSKANE